MAAVPPLAGWSRCVPEDQQGCCGPDCYKTNNKYNNGPYFMFLFCFSVPFCTIVFCCSHRLRMPKPAAKAQAESASNQKAEREVAGMVVVLVLGFLVCWMPFASFALWVINNHWNPFDWQPPLNKQFCPCVMQCMSEGGDEESLTISTVTVTEVLNV